MKRLKLIALANEMALDADETKPIRIPFGKWPYGMKRIKTPDGTEKQIYITQELTQAGAGRIAADLAAAVAGGSLGIPVYEGHPDVPELAHKYPNKAAIGWVKEITTDDGAALLRVEWIKFPGRGFGWFSPYWFGAPVIQGESAMMPIDFIKSIGLTNDPNILEFRLANEAGDAEKDNDNGGSAATNKDTKTMDKAKLCELLGIDPNSTEEQIAAEITKNKAAAANATTQIDAANAEAADAKKKLDAEKTACANERKARIALLLDNAVAGGHITPAMKPAWQKKLEADLDGGVLALANERAMKTKAETDGLNPERTQAKPDLVALANEKMAKQPGLTFEHAWARCKQEHPDLYK